MTAIFYALSVFFLVALIVVLFYKYKNCRNAAVFMLLFSFCTDFLVLGSQLMHELSPYSQILTQIATGAGGIITLLALNVFLLVYYVGMEKDKSSVVMMIISIAIILVSTMLFFTLRQAQIFHTVMIISLSFFFYLLVIAYYFKFRQKEIFLFVLAQIFLVLGLMLSVFVEALAPIGLLVWYALLAFSVLWFRRKEDGKILFDRLPIGASKIGTSTVMSIFALTLIILFAGGTVIFTSFKSIFNTQLENSLSAASDARANDIESYLQSYEREVALIANSSSLKELLEANRNDIAFVSKKEKVVTEFKQYLDLGEVYQKISLINDKGEILASTDQKKVDPEPEEIEALIESQEIIYKQAHYSESYDGLGVDILFPVFDKERLVGGIIFDLSLDQVLNVTKDEKSLWSAERLYLVDRNNDIVSYESGEKVDSFEATIERKSAGACLAKKEGETYKEKRRLADGSSERIIGSSSYLPSLDWCVLTEASEDRDFSVYQDALLIAFLFCLAIAVFGVGTLGYFVARNISKPLKKLQGGVKIIEDGDLEFRVKIKSKDEIGELADSFNKMAMALQKAREGADFEVKRRTGEVLEKTHELEESQEATLNILEDVQEEKTNVAQGKRRVEAIISSVSDGLFVTDVAGRIILFNPMAEELSGFKESDAVGAPYSEILRFESETGEETDVDFIEKTLRSGEISSIGQNTLLVTKKKIKIPVTESAGPIMSQGKVVGAVGIIRDATKEREVARMKSGFVSIASHQLRTPLSAIKWLLEMVLGGEVGKLNSEQVDYLTQVFESNERLINLVNDLLKVSRLETRRVKVEPEKVQITDIIKLVIEDQQINAKAHNCEIRFDELDKIPEIKVDPILVRNIIENLVTNAVDYSKPGRKNIVTIRARKRKKVIEIQIKDKGIGIPKKEQLRIFEMFYRSNEAVKVRAEGTGLGLYIANMIVDLSGGETWFKSEEGKGSSFYFTLPLAGSKRKSGERSLNE